MPSLSNFDLCLEPPPVPAFQREFYKNKTHNELVEKIWQVEHETYQLRDILFNFLENEAAVKRLFAIIAQKVDSNNNIPSIRAIDPDLQELFPDPPIKFLNPKIYAADENYHSGKASELELGVNSSDSNDEADDDKMLQKSYAAAAKSKKSISANIKPFEAARQIIREEMERPMREKSVILTNIPSDISIDALASIVKKVKEHADIAGTVRLTLFANKTMARVEFISKEDATKFLVHFLNFRFKKSAEVLSIRARKDLSKLERYCHKQLWSEAIKRNDQLGSCVWTVKNFGLVKLKTPGLWNKQDRSLRIKNSVKKELDETCSIA